MSCGHFGHASPYSTSSLIQLPSITPMPPHSASFIASRSIVRLTAWRTRLSWNGFFGSWKPGNSSHQLPDTTGASRSFGLFFTRSINSPGTKYMMSASPRSSMATRVAASGTLTIVNCLMWTGR